MSIWNLHANQMRTLKGRLGFKAEGPLEFFAYSLELTSGRIFDKLKGKYITKTETLYALLSHYAKNDPIERVRKLIKFRDLPGGYAYDAAFTRRAAHPIAEMFRVKPKRLVKVAEPLNGIEAKYGDLSVEIPALPKVPLVYILWKSNEFPASSNILLDVSASHYLPTEDIAALGEITTARLKSSLEQLQPS